MSSSDAKYYLPQPGPVPPGVTVCRVWQRCPTLSWNGLLHWARPSSEATDRNAYKTLGRAGIRRSTTMVESGTGPVGAAPLLPEPLDVSRAITEAMGVAFAGNQALAGDPASYMLLPQECPLGVPPVGILAYRNRFHLFVSEEDTYQAMAWLGPQMILFLDAFTERPEVLWHLLSKRVLAYGGTQEAVAVSGVPPDYGFVVWQWAPDGLVAAAIHARRAVVGLISLRQRVKKGEWAELVAFRQRASDCATHAYTTPLEQMSLLPHPAPHLLGGKGPKNPSRALLLEPQPAAPGDNEFANAGPQGVETPQNGQNPAISPAEHPSSIPLAPPKHPAGIPEASTVKLSPDDSTAAGRVAAHRDKIIRHLNKARMVGNPEKVADLEKQLAALDAAQ